VLVHMLRADGAMPMTSEKLAQIMGTNAVVIRRVFSGLKKAGFVSSEKGHGGGWRVACDPAGVTLAEIYEAAGAPVLLAMGHRTEAPGCLVEQSVNASLEGAFLNAEAAVRARLQQVTLADLVQDVNRRYEQTPKKKVT
jgi:DNA-binding IscR family transcriptional regulator